MSTKNLATLTSKGQITIPSEIRAQWNLKAGDKIAFEDMTDTKGTIRPERRRSIFERLDELQLPALGRRLTQQDIDKAIGDEIAERHGSLTSRKKR